MHPFDELKRVFAKEAKEVDDLYAYKNAKPVEFIDVTKKQLK